MRKHLAIVLASACLIGCSEEPAPLAEIERSQLTSSDKAATPEVTPPSVDTSEKKAAPRSDSSEPEPEPQPTAAEQSGRRLKSVDLEGEAGSKGERSHAVLEKLDSDDSVASEGFAGNVVPEKKSGVGSKMKRQRRKRKPRPKKPRKPATRQMPPRDPDAESGGQKIPLLRGQDDPAVRRNMMNSFSAREMMAMEQQGRTPEEIEAAAKTAMLSRFGAPQRVQQLQNKVMPPEPVEPPEQMDGFANRVIHSERIVSKPMTETSVDPRSTFSIDVDTGAYALARARLRQGYRPKAADVRIEEFLNYFHYDYPEPEAGEFSVHLEAAPDPFATAGNRHLIRIGVKGKGVPDAERPPAHLTFLVDVSGSMFGPDKLGLAIEALDLVTRGLRADDTVAVVTYAKGARVRLWPAGATERDLALSAISGLEPGGSSSLDDGLQLAYQVAGTHFHAGHVNRVVLLSDGRANVGETDPEVLLKAAQTGVEDGVMLSTIGFGAKAFNDRMMEKLADSGSGSYFFVDSYREAQRVFGDQLCGTIFAIAEDVKIQVEFERNSVVRYRLLGYENRKLEHKEFRDDTVDAGEIGAGHSVTALYEVELLPSPAPVIASVSIRHKRPGETRATETNFQLLAGELNKDVRVASPDFKFAAAVALFAQILRGEEPGDEARLSLVKEIAMEGVPNPEQQPDRVEFLALVDEAMPYYAD